MDTEGEGEGRTSRESSTEIYTLCVYRVLRCVWFCATPCPVARQAPVSLQFSRWKYHVWNRWLVGSPAWRSVVAYRGERLRKEGLWTHTHTHTCMHAHIYVHTLTADSSCCMAETNTAVWSKYFYSVKKKTCFCFELKEIWRGFLLLQKRQEAKTAFSFFGSQMSVYRGSWIPSIEWTRPTPSPGTAWHLSKELLKLWTMSVSICALSRCISCVL